MNEQKDGSKSNDLKQTDQTVADNQEEEQQRKKRLGKFQITVKHIDIFLIFCVIAFFVVILLAYLNGTRS